MLKNFLTDNNIAFKEVNVEKDTTAMQRVVQTTGKMGVPQSEVNGTWVLGFDPNSIMNALKN
ncbi:glutaredoxin [Aquibacillus albus]|uniref:Glutaredoxin n=1 Tax=Aquibacillus albus TaxID=1168171 RepID=A0ABS2N5V3_9BACI|nr:glutaredoxin [Aquibacillus albus]